MLLSFWPFISYFLFLYPFYLDPWFTIILRSSGLPDCFKSCKCVHTIGGRITALLCIMLFQSLAWKQTELFKSPVLLKKPRMSIVAVRQHNSSRTAVGVRQVHFVTQVCLNVCHWVLSQTRCHSDVPCKLFACSFKFAFHHCKREVKVRFGKIHHKESFVDLNEPHLI